MNNNSGNPKPHFCMLVKPELTTNSGVCLVAYWTNLVYVDVPCVKPVGFIAWVVLKVWSYGMP